MKKSLNKKELFMMFSNIFLILPIFFSWMHKELIYLFFSTGIFIFSCFYHWYKINSKESIYKYLDWIFAIGSFIYMYYYVSQYIEGVNEIILYILLSVVILFFIYGWKFSDYEKTHPWFHIFAAIISTIILIVGN